MSVFMVVESIRPATVIQHCERLRSRSPIGPVGDQLRQFPDFGLAQLVPGLVSLHSCRLRLLSLLRSVVVLRRYRYLLSSSFQVNATFIDQNFDDYGIVVT